MQRILDQKDATLKKSKKARRPRHPETQDAGNLSSLENNVANMAHMCHKSFQDGAGAVIQDCPCALQEKSKICGSQVQAQGRGGREYTT